MRILAVDDDPSILEVLDATLNALDGHTVKTAHSGAHALRMLDGDSERFDCLLVDIQMPEMNGIDLCREVRARNAYGRVPILMLTAMSQRTYIAEAFRAGASDYITKPFDLIDLRTRLSAALRDKRREEHAEVRRADVDAPIEVRGVSRVLGHSEYENYVLQVSQSLGSRSSVVAIKIAGIDVHFATLDADRFEAMIAHVARVISKLTRQNGHVISYRGHGIFLCIRIGRQDPLPAAFESMINRHIQSGDPMIGNGRPVLTVVGETLTLHSGSKARALDTLTWAISSAEERSLRLDPAPSVSKRVLSNETRSEADRLLDRRAYSRLLGDVLNGDLDGPAPLRWAN